jgi:hypothetical protein
MSEPTAATAPDRDRFKHLPSPVRRDRLVADRGVDAHEEWDDDHRETRWFLRSAGG